MSEESTKGTSQCDTCREPDLLLWLAAGTLAESERARVEESVRRCPACRSRLAEGDALARVIRSTSPTPASLHPQALVEMAGKPLDESALASLSRTDREILEVLRRVDADLAARESRSKWLERARDLLAAIRPNPGAGLGAWLRSPAVAYLAVLALAYPAYRGLTGGFVDGESAPAVLSAPLGIDGPNRGDSAPLINVRDDRSPTVVTVFVPVDERYRYRIEIVDSEGRTRFRNEDARSFDAYGTFAVLLPRGFLAAGAYELRVDELDEEENVIEVFRFPFRVD